MKKYTLDFIFVFLVLTLVLMVACTRKVEEAPKEDDFLKIPEYKTETPTTSTYTSTYDDGNSYWFIVAEEKDGTMKLNTFIKQNHKYFSGSEAKAGFKKDVFILNIVEVSKETYENNHNE